MSSESRTLRFSAGAAARLHLMPAVLKLAMRVFETVTLEPLVMLTPRMPRVVPAPLMSMSRRTTRMPAVLTLTPFTPLARMLPSVPVQSMVTDLVIVTAPYPPGSMQLMMPGAAVLERAPANVLHGAVRLHGFRSSPTPETHVRVCACARLAVISNPRANKTTFDFIGPPSLSFLGVREVRPAVDLNSRQPRFALTRKP